jgi:hypothetical protein
MSKTQTPRIACPTGVALRSLYCPDACQCGGKGTVPATVEHVTANLLAVRQSATRTNVLEGRAWYPAMGAMIRTVRDDTACETGDYSVSDALAVGVFAAFSQNATWKANVTMARNYLLGNGRGMTRVLAECAAMEEGADPTDASVLGLKRADFCANLLGVESRVTCDRWHLRAAFATDTPPSLTPAVHALVTEATRIVAKRYRETPAQCQAVIWCAVRGDGK